MRICVFCGSRSGSDRLFTEAARLTGEEIAGRGHSLVYGGASSGLMGNLADAAIEGGAEAIGIMPAVLANREIEHPGLTVVHRTVGMHDRKALMHETADAYVSLPGGFGTLEEFAEVLSWQQIGLLSQPIAFLNTRGIYDGLVKMLRDMERFGFVSPEAVASLIVEESVPCLFDRIEEYRAR